MKRLFYWLAIILLIIAILGMFFLPYVVVPAITLSYLCALTYNTIRYNELYMYTEETLRRVEYFARDEDATIIATLTHDELEFLTKEYK